MITQGVCRPRPLQWVEPLRESMGNVSFTRTPNGTRFTFFMPKEYLPVPRTEDVPPPIESRLEIKQSLERLLHKNPRDLVLFLDYIENYAERLKQHLAVDVSTGKKALKKAHMGDIVLRRYTHEEHPYGVCRDKKGNNLFRESKDLPVIKTKLLEQELLDAKEELELASNRYDSLSAAYERHRGDRDRLKPVEKCLE